jgi:hypothetical protein
MFTFDMYVHGVQGDSVEQLSEEELEVFGVDWEALRDDAIIRSQCQNNSTQENAASWIGNVGPPQNLDGVSLEAPKVTLEDIQLDMLCEAVLPLAGESCRDDIIQLWYTGLTAARSLFRNYF